MQTCCFWSKFDIQSAGVLEKEVKVTKIKSLLSHVQLVFMCNLGQNLFIGSEDRVQ